MFAVISGWRVDAELDAEQLGHVTANVREQQGLVRGYRGQETEDHTYAHAFVVLEDEAGARAMAAGVCAATPSTDLRVVRVLADA